MTMRKPNINQQMLDLKNEVLTTEIFMTPLVRESERLDDLHKERRLTRAEMKRANELIELIHNKNCWIAEANKKLGAYYAPATA